MHKDIRANPAAFDIETWLDDLRVAAEAFRCVMVREALPNIRQDVYWTQLTNLQKALEPLNYLKAATPPDLAKEDSPHG